MLAASKAVRQHAGLMLDAMVQDLERGTGPWHAEWVALPESFVLSAGALHQARFMLGGLIVDPERMARNLDMTDGLIVAEAVMMGWIDKLTSRALRVNTLVEVEELADLPSHASQLRQQLQELARLVMELYGDTLKSQKDSWGPARVRAPRGMLPEPLLEPLGKAAHHA